MVSGIEGFTLRVREAVVVVTQTPLGFEGSDCSVTGSGTNPAWGADQRPRSTPAKLSTLTRHVTLTSHNTHQSPHEHHAPLVRTHAAAEDHYDHRSRHTSSGRPHASAATAAPFDTTPTTDDVDRHGHHTHNHYFHTSTNTKENSNSPGVVENKPVRAPIR